MWVNKNGTKPQLNADGVFGDGTLTGLKAFQKKNNIKPDGIAGPNVWKALNVKP